ncbi:hypothetical protein OC513_22250 [Vibrio vulnificus]|nr:hypothetical protein [Vibrio vulnificus]
MVTALCGSFCIACLRPLTRRYVLRRQDAKNVFRFMSLWSH